jgi:uncharacterized glyoxalase superfamily protein PhnB
MNRVHPIVTTPALLDCAAFYERAFDAQVVFRNTWYAHVSLDGWEIGFLHPNPPQRTPVFQQTTPTRGLCLAVEVEDVRATAARLQDRGVALLGPLRSFAHGEVSCSVMDPAGVVLNIVERREPRTDLDDL